MEWILAILGLVLITIAIVGPIAALVLVAILLRRVGDLRARIAALEAGRWHPAGDAAAPFPAAPAEVAAEILVAETVPAAAVSLPATGKPVARIDWEQLIGRKGLGWVAVVLLLLSVAFFLRYAYENNWIGPQGRVGVGILTGLALVLSGWRYHRRGWRIFSQMVSSAGIVVLYLSVYSSFGFYQLVPQLVAASFMLVIIVQSGLAAVLYRSAALAWMSLAGGFSTPVLMSSEVDQYPSYFIYLFLLNVGVIVLGRLRHWAGLGTAALLATHVLFWMWYARWYHPEKFAWVLGFQLAIYVVFVFLDVWRRLDSARRAGWEDLLRLLLNAFLWFTAAFVLLRTDYREWLGVLAVSMAGVYVLLARLALAPRAVDQRQLVTALAAAVGFIGLAFPIQADAEWVAMGWAAEAAALWWFGLRIRGPALRIMAGALMVLAAGRLLLFDLLQRPWLPDLPIVNEYALPALGVVACLLGSLVAAKHYRGQLGTAERVLMAASAVAGLLLLWLVLTVDLHGYFRVQAGLQPDEAVRWRWLGQLAISALWAVYAVILLGIGFARGAALLRWTALLIFGLATGKVLLFDISGLQEFYRILAFFVVAVLLGLGGWAYQRIRVDAPSATSEARDDETRSSA